MPMVWLVDALADDASRDHLIGTFHGNPPGSGRASSGMTLNKLYDVDGVRQAARPIYNSQIISCRLQRD
eukprot:scaffold59752_cov31-Prasinocladus_malaysianus.AAC.1